MPKISVILATYNEGKNIRDCLESVKWVDEIVIVDGTSTDKTVEVASSIGRSASGRKKPKIKIIVRENPLMFHINKQMAIEKATGDWILYLDADERVSKKLKEEILSTLKKPAFTGYWLPRRNIIFGKWIMHAGWYPDFQLRLFKRGKARLPCKSVHEQPVLDGKAGHLKNDLIHHNYRTVSQFVKKLNELYTENDKNVFLSQGKKISSLDAIRFPKNEFLKRYFKEQGYKDGLHGLVLSLLQSFSSLVLFAKIWEEEGFKEENGTPFFKRTILEFKKSFKEFRYWSLKTEFSEDKKGFLRELWFRTRLRLPF